MTRQNPKQKTKSKQHKNTTQGIIKNSFIIIKNTMKNYPKMNEKEFQHETW